jgi:chemotaxis protein MotB
MLERNQFKIRVDGHLDTAFQPASLDYTAWELSADRANAVRRALERYAVPAERFERVTGFGKTVPLSARKPDDPANERIEISLVLVEPLKM